MLLYLCGEIFLDSGDAALKLFSAFFFMPNLLVGLTVAGVALKVDGVDGSALSFKLNVFV